MTDHRLSSYGVLLLRLALGTMFIAHSVIYMLFTLTLSGTSKFFNSIGLPSPFQLTFQSRPVSLIQFLPA